MRKRVSKAEREAQAKAALRQRVADIMSGGVGTSVDGDAFFGVMAEDVPRIAVAIRERLVCGDKSVPDDKLYLFAIHNVGNYENADKLTELLWNAGIRA